MRSLFQRIHLVKLSSNTNHRQNRRITIEQFKNIIHLKVIRKLKHPICRCFTSCALTGTAFLDSQQLTIDHLEESEKGLKLLYTRNKTGHSSEQYLCSKAIELIKSFDKRPDVQTSKFLLPKVSNQQFNRELKIIGARAGFLLI